MTGGLPKFTRTMWRTPLYNQILENVDPRPLTSRQRTGRVFFLDKFENYYNAITEKWKQSAGTIALNTDYPKSHGSCMSLTTGEDADDYATATLYLGSFPKGRFGVEVDLAILDNMDNISYFTIRINYWDGAFLHIAEVRWLGQDVDRKFQYGISATEYGDIEDGDYNVKAMADVPIYHNMKMVADFTKEEFVKLIFNNKEYDLTGISYRKEVDTATEGIMAVLLSVMNFVDGDLRILYADNLILTDKEP